MRHALGSSILSALLILSSASCGPGGEGTTVRLRFGGERAGDVAVRQAGPQGCVLNAFFITIVGPGIPRTRIPIKNARVANLTFSPSTSFTLLIPDQTIRVPAGPSRVISIVGRMDLGDSTTCEAGSQSFPVYGEVGPVDIAPDVALTLEMRVRASTTAVRAFDGDIGFVPHKDSRMQTVTFRIPPALASDMNDLGCNATRLRIFDTTVDGEQFRLTPLGGAIISFSSMPTQLEVGPLLPNRRYEMVFADVDGCADGAKRTMTLNYRTPASGVKDANDHEAICERIAVRSGKCALP